MVSSFLRGMAYVKVFVDNVVIGSKSRPEHVEHLAKVCTKIREIGLKVKLSKCELVKEKIEVLVYVIESRGQEANPRRTLSVANVGLPETKNSSNHSPCSAL